MDQHPHPMAHAFPSNLDPTAVPFPIANRQYVVKVGENCSSLLDHWEDEDVVRESGIVEPGDHDWYTVTNTHCLRIDPAKAKAATSQVAAILTEQSDVLHRINVAILEETGSSKFIPFEDVLELIKYQNHTTTNAVTTAIALILSNPNFKFFNNGVAVNWEGDVLILDDHAGWTEASAILLSLAGITDAPAQRIQGRASAFKYGPPRGCSYGGRANRAMVEKVAVTSTPDPHVQKYGVSGDGRYANRNYLIFKSVSGKIRKVYLEGNLMFVSGMRGRSIVSQIPVQSLELMGMAAFELREGHKGLEVPTNAMFDVIVRSINAGNNRVSMWFTPKVLSGEIVVCKGLRTMTCYFREAVDLQDVEFGPTIRCSILQSGSELGYVVNVGKQSYLLANPYDSHGFEIFRVGDNAYHTRHSEVPTQDRYLVEDASNMFFGGINS